MYITQILTGLSQIHRSGGTQKSKVMQMSFLLTIVLDLDYILLCSAGDNTLLKLSGTGYARRIIDLHRSNPFLRSTEANIPDSWYVFDTSKLTPGYLLTRSSLLIRILPRETYGMLASFSFSCFVDRKPYSDP